jgi:PAS domain S-box-containing protein
LKEEEPEKRTATSRGEPAVNPAGPLDLAGAGICEDIINSLPDMVTVHDREFNIVKANKAAEKILKLPTFDLDKCYRYFHGMENPPSACPSCQCLQTGKPSSFEMFEPHLKRQLEVRASPIKDGAGQVRGIIHIVRDVTERRQAEDRAAALLQELKTIFDGLPIGVAYLDTDFRFINANRALCRFAGKKEGELIGRHCYDVIGEHAHDAARKGRERVCGFCRIDESSRLKKPVAIERQLGGSIVRVTAIPEMDENGEVVRFLETFEDITAQKKAEDSLHSTLGELERSNRDLEQFAYIASHDLREPLRAVVGFVQLLAKRYRGKLDRDADEYIDFAVSGANRMDSLISDLLAYSRVGAGMRLEPVASEAALSRALANLRTSIGESGAGVTHDALPKIVANGTRLTQLFQNLVGNAIKFRGEDPPRVHISAQRRAKEWEFAVRDNGIGIAAEHGKRIFEVFQRLHGRGKYPGTGIGLAICKKIVELHGGRIWVEPARGKGSTFHFTIPDRHISDREA